MLFAKNTENGSYVVEVRFLNEFMGILTLL